MDDDELITKSAEVYFRVSVEDALYDTMSKLLSILHIEEVRTNISYEKEVRALVNKAVEMFDEQRAHICNTNESTLSSS